MIQSVSAKASDGTLREDFADTVKLLRDRVTTQSNATNKQEIYDFLDDVFTPLCDKMKGIAIFLQRTKVYSTSEELEQNCEKCKEFVAFYRQHLVKTENSIIGQKFVSPKMHYLEDHIPDFAMRWGVVGLFGEDVVETLHKEVNEYRRRFAEMKNRLQYMQVVSDEMNLKFELEAKKGVSVHKNTHKKRKAKAIKS